MVVSRSRDGAAALFAAAALVSVTSASSLEHREAKQPNTFIRQRRHHAMRRENTTVAAKREDALQHPEERGLLGDTLNGVGQLVGGILGVPPKTTQPPVASPQPTQQPSNPNPSPNPNPAPAPAPAPSSAPGGSSGGGNTGGSNGGTGGNQPAQPAQPAQPVDNPSSGSTGGNTNNGGGNAPVNNSNGNGNNGVAASAGNASPVQAFIAGQTSVASPNDAALASAAATLGGQAGALQSVTVTQGTRVFTAAVPNPTSSSDLVGASNVDTDGNPTVDGGESATKKSGGSNVAIPIAVVVVLVVVAAIIAFFIRKRRANRRDRPSEYAGYGRARRANTANKTLSGDSWLAGRQTAYYTDADPAATFHSSADADLTMPAMSEHAQPEMSERPLSSFGEADMNVAGGYRPESSATIRMPASQSTQSRGLYQLSNATPGSRRTFFDTYQSEQDDAMWSAESHSNSRHSDGLFYDGSATAGYSNAAARGMDEAGAEHAGVPSPYRDVQRGSTFGGDHEIHSNRSSASVLPYDNKNNYRHPEAQRISRVTAASGATSRYSGVSEQSAAPSVFSASADHGEALMMSDDPFNVVADNQNSSMDFDDGATTVQQKLPQHPLSPQDFSRTPDASRWSG